MKPPTEPVNSLIGFRLLLNIDGAPEAGAYFPTENPVSEIQPTVQKCEHLFEALMEMPVEWDRKNISENELHQPFREVVSSALVSQLKTHKLMERLAELNATDPHPIYSELSSVISKIEDSAFSTDWIAADIVSVTETKDIEIEGAEWVEHPYYIYPIVIDENKYWMAGTVNANEEVPIFGRSDTRQAALAKVYRKIATGKTEDEEHWEQYVALRGRIGNWTLVLLLALIGIYVLWPLL